MMAKGNESQLLLSAAEAAKRCGCSVRTWRTRDRIGLTPPPVRIGRSVYWRPDELSAGVEAGCPDRKTWLKQQDG